MNILGIETSCDECSMAIVENGKKILSHVVATQMDIHHAFSGVVPEIASRLHVQWIGDVFQETLRRASLQAKDLDGIAVSSTPGLIGSLVVGVEFARGLALGLDLPVFGINHLKAHLYAAFLEYSLSYPYLGVLVSGGHTLIAYVRDYDSFEIIGNTLDDACGEAFDKIAKYFGLGFPGGRKIEEQARLGNPHAYVFPKAHLDSPFDFSYSGLKSAVIHQRSKFLRFSGREKYKSRENRQENEQENIADIFASFQEAALEMIVERVERALEKIPLSIVVGGGGVFCNLVLREKLGRLKMELMVPSPSLCSDNGAMVAGIGYHYFQNLNHHSLRNSLLKYHDSPPFSISSRAQFLRYSFS